MTVNRVWYHPLRKTNVEDWGQVRELPTQSSPVSSARTMGVEAATVQKILRHSSISVTTGTYVEVIESVKRNALDPMGTLRPAIEAGTDEVG